MNRDIYYQTSVSQAILQDSANIANNMLTGISSNYRTYEPSSSRFSTVAPTRSSAFNPQRGISTFYGSGRYSAYVHQFANSSAIADNGNRISYLALSASRPNVYYSGQDFQYPDPIKAAFSNQAVEGTNFYRISDGNKVVIDQYKNADRNVLWYNHTFFDNNLLTISNAGAMSKIENTTGTNYLDNTTNPSTPLLFQTHGGMPQESTTSWRTDYARDAAWTANSRDNYIIYKPNFGSNVQMPGSVETMGEWASNRTGERSGSWRDKR